MACLMSLTRLRLETNRRRMQSVPDPCMSRRSALIVFLALLLNIVSARAIIFYSTGDPNYNTTAPVSSLTNSGWQYEGFWGDFLGTPIAPKYFISASHIYVQPGTALVFRGVSYTAITNYDDPSSDLRIWRICGTFPEYAQLYSNTNEVGQSLVVIGRGTQRGAPVTTTDVLGAVKTNGWQWGPYDGLVRWGENAVAGVVDGDSIFGSGLGALLQATFDASGGANECHLSFGDSGGALFIKDGSVWTLAGINYAVDGPYNTTNTDLGFDAAIFDGVGLYEKDIAGIWLPASGPGSFYATRVSAHASWINSVINANVAAVPPILQSSTSAADGYADEINATVDASKTITVALPGGSRFYRLRACDPLTIKSIQVQNGTLVLTYQ
jgi:hypothetical protein